MDGHGKIVGKSGNPRVEGPPLYLGVLARSNGHDAFYDAPDNCSLILEAINTIVADRRVSLLSVDMFDTALLRSQRCELERFRSASVRFHEQASHRKSCPGFSAEDAFLARLTAARAAYDMRRPGETDRDPGLEKIAKTVCALLGRPDLAEAYVKNEIASEIEDVRVNPLLRHLRQRFPGLRTIFLSDTYLEGIHIRRIFAARSRTRGRPKIISSADGFGSKEAGTLFAHVERTLGIEPGEALHIGDNLDTDYLSPKRRGWNALHLPLPKADLSARRASFERERTGHLSSGMGFHRGVVFAP